MCSSPASLSSSDNFEIGSSAFAAISKNATKVDAYTAREITKADRDLYTRPAPPAAQADSPLVHSEMIDLLSSVVREGTGRAAQIDQSVAGKTGTSQDYRDAWFVGFTSDLVVGVWVGNDDNAAMKNVTGGSLPATIWHDFVSGAEPLRRSQEAAATPVRGTVANPTNSAPETSANVDSRVLRGTATVLDSGAIQLEGRVIRLLGVDNAGRRGLYVLRHALRHREMTCTQSEGNSLYDCRVGEFNLSAVILNKDGQFANDNADPEFKGADAYAYRNGNVRRRQFGFRLRRRFFHW